MEKKVKETHAQEREKRNVKRLTYKSKKGNEISKKERVVIESCLERIRLKASQQIAWNTALSSPWLAKFIMSEE